MPLFVLFNTAPSSFAAKVILPELSRHSSLVCFFIAINMQLILPKEFGWVGLTAFASYAV